MANRLLESGSTRLLEAAGTNNRLLEITDVDAQPYTLTVGTPRVTWSLGIPQGSWSLGTPTT